MPVVVREPREILLRDLKLERLPERMPSELERKFHLQIIEPLGNSVLVDKVCKNFPIMFRDICFSADLMLLPFDEFDIILGMDWLTLHDAVVNCKRKIIDLKGQNDEIVQIESVSKKKVESVPVVCEFSDVFPEKLSRLPPIRDVEFGIDAWYDSYFDSPI
ncbi:gag-pol polyprotein [Gossypium australe]|uniref:Gag-pol polyprotein n=1 Tax=Gossypium australe TaxID=47621 RepID=A0A5B6WGG4_9ROSI|nr:gag-pol polyprotein [Gossypium australe]